MSKSALLLLCIIASSYICDAYKVLVIFPLPGKSHNILGEGVVRHLLNAGHEVTYVTPFPKNGTTPNLQYVDLSSNMDILPRDFINLKTIMESKVSQSWMRYFVVFIGNWIAAKSLEHENFQKLLADPNEHFDLVIGEWFFNELYSSTAAVFNAPYIWLSTIEPHWMILSLIDETLNPSYNGFDVTDKPPFTFWQRVQELCYTATTTAMRETIAHYLQYREYSKLVAPHIEARGRVPPSFEELKYNSSLVFGNSHVSMGGASRLPQSYIPIGGYHIKDKTEPLPENLKKIIEDARHGVIYFSMGSNLNSKELPDVVKTSLLKMFASLKQTVLWKFEEALPDLPKNVHIIAWAPQQSILAHPNVILFITHGGLLSTTETIYAGKPIIGIPVFSDQFINVIRAVSRGFAKKVDLSYNMADDLKIAIDEILGEPKFTQKAKELQFVHHDRPVKPGDELVHWSEHVIKTQGAPHLRSPALLVPWYQKLYIDLVAVLIILWIAFRYLYRYIRGTFNKKLDGEKKSN